jgi:hypothetical protein
MSAPTPYELGNIPAYLRDREQWVCWKRESNEKGQTTKKPYQALAPDHHASCDAPETWASALEAVAAYLTPANAFDGIGYQLTDGEKMVGVDIDHCIDESGALNAASREIVETLNSYTERSPSGRGIRIFVRGSLPPQDRKNGHIEMYEKRRFLTVTGWHVAGTPLTIETRETEIRQVHEKHVARVRTMKTSSVASPAMPDHQVLSRCRSARNREKFIALYDNGWMKSPKYPSPSEARYALLHLLSFYTQDPEQIDRLFRGSKLVDEKWDRVGATEIGKVLAAEGAVFAKPEPQDETDDTAGNLADGLQVTSLSTVQAQNVAWLWPQYIPLGMLTLVVGDPEQGKSTITFDLAGRMTTGRPWPDGTPGGEPERIVLLSSEDSPAHTIVPRLCAAGADAARVQKVQSVVAQGKERHFSLQHDLQALDDYFAREPFKALIVDPINSYLPNVDTYRDNEVRAILDPLAHWAERREVAVIAIMHMGKNTDRNALQRVLGSTAFVAAARACYVACRDATVEGRRLLLNSKMSVAGKPPGLAFRFEERTVPAGDEPISTVGIAWEPGTVTITADEALRQLMKTAPQVRDEAKKFLAAALSSGPVPTEELKGQAKAAGLSWRSLERTKVDLGVRSIRVGGLAAEGEWYWTPPGWSVAQISDWKTGLLRESLLTPPPAAA